MEHAAKNDRFASMMDSLWEVMTANWGKAFTSQFGVDWTKEPTWSENMRGLTMYQIKSALEICKYDDQYENYPPAARVFRKIAMKQACSSKTLGYDALREMILHWRGIEDDQKHPAALWIIRKAGANWERLLYPEHEKYFAKLYFELQEYLIKGGQLPRIEPVKRIEAQPLPKNVLVGLFEGLARELSA